MTERRLSMNFHKIRNYSSNLCFDASEGVDCLFTRSGTSFCKAYRDRVVWFHIHFVTNASEYCCVLKRNSSAKFHATGVTARNGEQVRAAFYRHGCFGQGVVLVCVTSFMK